MLSPQGKPLRISVEDAYKNEALILWFTIRVPDLFE
jgi:hypothetical protein